MAEQQLEATIIGQPLLGRAYPRLPEGVSPQQEGSAIGQGIEQAGVIAQQVQQHQDAVQQKLATQANQLRVIERGTR